MGLRQSEWSTKAEKTLKTTPSEPLDHFTRSVPTTPPWRSPAPFPRAPDQKFRSGERGPPTPWGKRARLWRGNALRYLVATKSRTISQRKLRGL